MRVPLLSPSLELLFLIIAGFASHRCSSVIKHPHLPSSEAILDGSDEAGIGLDLVGQLMADDPYQIVARQEIGGVAVGQALLGDEHNGNHHQRHVVVPSVPTADLIVGHAAGSLCFFKRRLYKMPRHLHFRQTTQSRPVTPASPL